MQSTVGSINLDSLFQALWQAQQDYLTEAARQADALGVSMPTNPAIESGRLLLDLYRLNTGKVAGIEGEYIEKQFALWSSMWMKNTAGSVIDAHKGDRRFDAQEWNDYPLFDYIKQSYLLASDALLKVIDSANLDDKNKEEVTFVARHFLDAMSPANYALSNPEVLKLAAETKGQSLVSGLKMMAEDLGKGYISISDEAAFEVGENLANTPGVVVYENELIQLIQYRATTGKVHAVPLVIVPSVVNKFYILDLAPESSFVRYYVSQGYTVFIVSWRNISPASQHLTWDDYVEKGVIAALEVASEITRQKKVNALGYCVGGSLLACALAVLASKGKYPLASMTLLIAMLDYANPGEIGVYLRNAFLDQRLKALSQGGIVSGKELSRAFASLRANDLVWSFVINNYLKGQKPQAFDLLYWNSDDSNFPGPMFSSYLRDCYAENKLIQPGAMTVCGEPVDLDLIDVPTYIFNASEDHLVPWKSGYESVKRSRSKVEFVLGGGGHITGPVNPFSRNKRNYWVDGDLDGSADAWLASAQSMPGSWWPHYAAWLKGHSGKEVAAPENVGNGKYQEIEAAPGRYVKERGI
ncbi:PHA/PHB synthase family protein [Paraburkholderia oxyphila]|uniref:PHA/PHB synthase family protein n=1 Tax=Paraburkholderia oxyphila TaxID=614212 RepID=UPI000489B2A4|nr:class I poly(R)-hydroxyalkanoic acid synthase [Paraburkholderia oxyphila]